MTSRLIWSGPIRPPVRPSKGQSGVLQAIDHSVTGLVTAQPPGIHTSALRVATHGQQVASLAGASYPSAEVQSAYSTAPADKTPIERTQSGATSKGQSEDKCNANEKLICIARSSSCSRASPIAGLMSYTGHSLGAVLTPLQRYSQSIPQPQSTGQWKLWYIYVCVMRINV